MADSIELMRKRVLDMAIRGELVEQRPEEEAAVPMHSTDKDVTKPFQIPESWRWLKMKEVSNFSSHESVPPNQIEQSSILYELEDIESSTGRIIQRKTMADRQSKSNKFVVQRGDILYGKLRPYLNKVVVAGEDGYCSTEIFPLRFFKGSNELYFMYYLRSGYFLNYAIENSQGTKMPRLGSTAGKNALVPVPPFQEQGRIVAKIEEIFALIDQIGERKEEALKIIQNMRQTALQDAIMGILVEQDETDEPASVLYERIQAEKEQMVKEKKIKKEKPLPEIEAEEVPFEIPETWKWVRLGDLLSKIGSGSTPKGGSKVYTDEGVPFIRSQNVYNDGLRLNNVAFISEVINTSKSGSQVFAGDILLNITGASIGRCALVPDDFEIGNVNQHVLINRVIDAHTRHYLHLSLTTPYIFSEIMGLQKGGTKEGLSATSAKLLKIPLPPLAEQHRIVEKLDEIMAICDQMEAIFNGSSEPSYVAAATE